MKKKPDENEMSIDEAAKIIIARALCGETAGCKGCYIDEKYTGQCLYAQDNAKKAFARHVGAETIRAVKDDGCIKKITVSVETAKEPPKKELPKRVSGYWMGGEMLARCETCKHMDKLDGGYCFCKKFHNTTIADGYCHNYEEYEDIRNEEET